MKSFFIKLGLTTFNNHHFSFERKNNLYQFKFIHILEWKSLSLDMIYSYRKMSLRELFQNINCVFVDYGIEHLPEKIHNEKLTLSLFDYCVTKVDNKLFKIIVIIFNIIYLFHF